MRTKRDLLYAWLLATLLSGIPSTLYALLTGGDPTEATRAAGAMVLLPESIAAAAVVHAVVSLFWSSVLWFALPLRHTPVLFPEVAALAFWPQLADHLMWAPVSALRSNTV